MESFEPAQTDTKPETPEPQASSSPADSRVDSQASSPRTEPTHWSWAVALLSTVFLLGVLYLGELISTGYWNAKLQVGFAETMNRDADLMFAVDNPEFSSLFLVESRQVKNLRPLLSFISQEDASKAAAYLKRQALPKTPLYNQLVQHLNALSEIHTRLQSGEDEMLKTAGLLDSLADEYLKLQTEVKAWLMAEQSPRMPDRSEVENLKVSFYTGGILADLPVIEGLPDEIADFKQLTEYYPLVKRGSPLPSAEVLYRQLNELRARSSSMKSTYSGLADKRDELADRKQHDEAAKVAKFQDTKETMRKLLIDLAKPDVDSTTANTYYLFRETLSSWGANLPELRI